MPVFIDTSLLSSTFQLIPAFGLSVLTPNFTDSPGLIDSDDVKIITPCEFFSPTHPFSVLKDLKLKSLPSQILKVFTSSSESFVTTSIAVSSNPMLLTETPSPYAIDGNMINKIENNNVIERKIPLVEDLFM